MHDVPAINNGIIYAVLDSKANAIIGGLQLHRADAAAIRAFGDIAANPETIICSHPEDFTLYRLGYLTTDNTISTDGHMTPIISGKQWTAAQQPEEHQPSLSLTPTT